MNPTLPTFSLRILVLVFAAGFWTTAIAVPSQGSTSALKGGLLFLFLTAQATSAFLLAPRLGHVGLVWVVVAILTCALAPVLLALVSALPEPTPAERAAHLTARAAERAAQEQSREQERAQELQRKRYEENRLRKIEEDRAKRAESLRQCQSQGHTWSDWNSRRWTSGPDLQDDDYQESMRVATSGYLYERYCSRCGEKERKAVRENENP